MKDLLAYWLFALFRKVKNLCSFFARLPASLLERAEAAGNAISTWIETFPNRFRHGVHTVFENISAPFRSILRVVHGLTSATINTVFRLKNTRHDLADQVDRGQQQLAAVSDRLRDSVEELKVHHKETPQAVTTETVNWAGGIFDWFCSLRVTTRVLIVTLALTTIATAISTPSILRAVKAFRSEQLLAESIINRNEGRMTEAFVKGQTAHLLNPHDTEALRNLINLAALFDHPQTLKWMRYIADLEQGKSDDQIQFVNEALDNHQLGLAFTYLNHLKDSSYDAATFLAEIRLLLMRGNLPGALVRIGEARARFPDDPRVQLTHALFHFEHTDDNLRTRSRLDLNQFEKRPDQTGILARVILLSDRDNTQPNDQIRRLHEIIKHPTTPPNLLLQAVSQSLDAEYASWPDIRESVIDHFPAERPAVRQSFTQWLILRGFTDDAAKLFPLTHAYETKAEFLLAAEVSILAGVSRSVREISGAPHAFRLTETEIHFLRFLIEKQTGDPTAAASHLELAISLSNENEWPYLYSRIQQHANRKALFQFFRHLQRATHNAPQVRMQALLLAYDLGLNNEVEDLVSDVLIDDSNNDPALTHLIAYLKAIHGIDFPDSRRALEQLATAYPAIYQFRASLAAIYHLEKRHKLAWKVLGIQSRDDPRPRSLSPLRQAFVHLIASSTGNETLVADLVPPSAIDSSIAAEQKLFNPAPL